MLGIDPFAKAKKPAAKRATAKGKKKEESRKVVSYEQRKGATNLAEMCIKVCPFHNLRHLGVLIYPTNAQMIGKYIENVEALGSIGSMNMDKVCRIISKGRRL